MKNASELLKRGICEHARALEVGEYSSVELTRAYLDRISENDGSIGAYITVCDDLALRIAKASDDRRARGEALGALDGIPCAVKDNICTAGVATTCASRLLDGHIPPYDATAIRLLYDAGAVLLGKTNMDEFGMGGSCERSAYGCTRNPHDRTRVPGGSSGGSAAAVAACEAVWALGSDTGGSVRQPAAFCGLVGMKPTYGSVSRYGLVAFASSLEQIGPITKSVRDCAAAMNILSAYDRRDAVSRLDVRPDCTSLLGKGVKGLRIGIVRELLDSVTDDSVRHSVLRAVQRYRELGASVEEISLPSVRYALSAYYVLSSAEASSNLSRFDGVRYGNRAKGAFGIEELYVRSRSEGFGDEVKRRIMLGTFVLSEGYYDEYYKKAQMARELISRELGEALCRYDMLISPTSPEGAYKIGERVDSLLDMYSGDVCTVCANLTGLPALSVPCGKDGAGMPLGVQLIGKEFSEPQLLRAALALEEVIGA